MLAFRSSTITAALVTTVVTTLAGCASKGWLAGMHKPSGPPAPARVTGVTGGPSDEPGDKAADPTRPVVIQTVRFQVLRVRGPAGLFSKSDKVWNSLNEDVLPIDRRALLVKNGLRIGVGTQDNWPQIKAVLDSAKVELFTDQRVVQNGYPLPLVIRKEPHEQTLFLMRPDGTMPGARFPRSTTVLRLAYSVPVDAPESLLLEVVPEIQLPSYRPPSKLTEHGWTEYASVEQGRPLWELASQVRIEPEHFLVVGPSPMVGRPHLAGTLLLCEEINGRDFESLCFITPTLERIETGSAP